MERLPARFKLAIPRIGEQFNAEEVEHIQLTQSESEATKDGPGINL